MRSVLQTRGVGGVEGSILVVVSMNDKYVRTFSKIANKEWDLKEEEDKKIREQLLPCSKFSRCIEMRTLCLSLDD